MGVTQSYRVADANSQGQVQEECRSEFQSEFQSEFGSEIQAETQGRCPRCGGSGTLRHGDQRYRTCLDCLGQGLLASVVGARLASSQRISSVASVSRAG
jgi:DnaJ-class molecular chaperone